MCIAAAIGIAGAVGAAATLGGASMQASASQNATNAQESMFNQQVNNEAPYRTAGQGAVNQLDYLEGIGPKTGVSSTAGGYGSLNTPFTTANWKSLSPMYNFDLQQGAQGTLNNSASTQGALSGAALSGLQANNQGMANNSFGQAFNQYQTQNQNVYSRLAGIANLGEAAASNQATGGSNYAQGIGQSITNTGTAIGGGIAGAGASIGNAGLLGALYQGGGLGGGGTPSSAYWDYGGAGSSAVDPYSGP